MAPRGRLGPDRAGRTTDRIGSVGLVLGGIVSVQLGAAFAKDLVGSLGVAGSVLVRSAMAAVVLLLLVRGRVRELTSPCSRSHLISLAGLGAALAGMNLAFYAAIDRIPLAIAVTLEFLGPLTVAVVGARRRRELVWIVPAAVGVVVLSGVAGVEVDGIDLVGVGLALLAGAGWASYIALGARVGTAYSSGVGAAGALAVATLLVMPFGVATAGATLWSLDTLLAGLVVGTLSSALPYALELAALRRIRPHVFGVVLSLEPAVAALIGLMVLGEALSVVQALAIGLVVSASIGAVRGATTPDTRDSG
jgi:inner membrane transporter RhtA